MTIGIKLLFVRAKYILFINVGFVDRSENLWGGGCIRIVDAYTWDSFRRRFTTEQSTSIEALKLFPELPP
jgi:hypothetical protein